MTGWQEAIGRRTFLGQAGLTALPLLGGALVSPRWRFGLVGGDAPKASPRLIPRQRDPANLEFPFAALNGPSGGFGG